jgi:nitrite reductase/ring-hydroxylating ferredoxin subunit
MHDAPASEPRGVAMLDLRRVVCRVDELADPGSREFTLGSGAWPLRGFVVRRREVLRAYVNHCPHAGAPLNWKPHQFLAPDAPLILCAMHGALFDMESGECISGPCEGLGLRRIPVCIDNGYVFLEPGVRLEEPADLGD